MGEGGAEADPELPSEALMPAHVSHDARGHAQATWCQGSGQGKGRGGAGRAQAAGPSSLAPFAPHAKTSAGDKARRARSQRSGAGRTALRLRHAGSGLSVADNWRRSHCSTVPRSCAQDGPERCRPARRWRGKEPLGLTVLVEPREAVRYLCPRPGKERVTHGEEQCGQQPCAHGS